MGRILIGAVLSGLVVFIYGFLHHVVLGMGDMGVSRMADEAAFAKAIEPLGLEAGLYIYPVEGMEGSEAEMAAQVERYQAGPSGLIIHMPKGFGMGTPKQMISGLLLCMLSALMAGFILAGVKCGYLARVGIVIGMALFAFVASELQYWNWYGFPRDFVLGSLLDKLGGWTLGGLLLAAIVRKPGQA